MNSSQFKDKQVMGLSGSQNDDFFELLNPQEEHSGVGQKKDILPSYDFMPIRSVGVSQSTNLEGSNVDGTRVWNSADSKPTASITRNYVSLDSNESAKVTLEKDQNTYHAVTVSDIDQTMKKHVDNLLHALEGISARLTQLESRSRHLESSVDDLKVSTGINHDSTDGKLRQLENILREVQTSVLVLRDKQVIAGAQLQLSKGEQQSENQNSTMLTNSVQQAASAPQQSHQPQPYSAALPQPHPAALPQPPQPLPVVPPPNAPPPPIPPQQNLPPAQFSTQLPQNQIPSTPQQEAYFPPPGQTPEATHQQYQLFPTQQPQPPYPPPHQHYQPAPQLSQYSQPLQPSQQLPPIGPVNPTQSQPPLSHHTEEIPHVPSQIYPPSIRQPPSMTQPSSGAPPSQQFYNAPSHVYEAPSSRSNSGFSPGYVPTSGPNFSDSYPYSGSPSHYGSSMMKPSQLSSSSAPSGGSSYPRLPTAQILPHALPTASSVGDTSNSGGTGNRVPIDDVVDKVSTMGFSRDQVRATVRKLTENGQSVDLNMVLDKLMNDGEVQSQKGWFTR